jgi:hypothetical protein
VSLSRMCGLVLNTLYKLISTMTEVGIIPCSKLDLYVLGISCGTAVGCSNVLTRSETLEVSGKVLKCNQVQYTLHNICMNSGSR